MANGTFPGTQFIKLQSTETQWRMLINGLLDHLSFKGVVERNPDEWVTINLKIQKIIPPENMTHDTKVKVGGNFPSDEFKNGFARVEKFFTNFYQKRIWIMFGTIEGPHPKNVVIIFYELFNLAVYTIQLEKENIEEFLPPGFSLN